LPEAIAADSWRVHLLEVPSPNFREFIGVMVRDARASLAQDRCAYLALVDSLPRLTKLTAPAHSLGDRS
jgi:hypothetical protein